MSDHLSTQHLSAKELEDYHKRTISEEDLRTLKSHIRLCRECRDRMCEVERVDERLSYFFADLAREDYKWLEHLSFRQMAAYVDERPRGVDRRLAEEHMKLCPVCAEDVRDLLRLKEELKVEVDNPFIKGMPVPAESVPQRVKQTLFWQWSAISVGRHAPIGAFPLLLITMLGIAIKVFLLPYTSTEQQVNVTSTPVPRADPSVTGQPRPEGPTKLGAVAARGNGTGINDREAQAAPSTAVRRQRPKSLSTLGNSDQAVLTLIDGDGKLSLNAAGRLRGAELLEPALREAMRKSLREGQITPSPLIAELRVETSARRAGPEASGNDSFSLISPVGTAVLAERPTFSWQPLPEASGYLVTVFDSKYEVVAKSGLITETEWTTPAQLARGGAYRWQVTAVKGDQEMKSPLPPAPPAKFKVLDGAKAAEIEKAKRISPRHNLALGILYAEAGLIDDAKRELQSLVECNPRSRLAKKLLLSLTKE